MTTAISKPEMARLIEIKDGRVYPRSQKAESNKKLVERGLAEWLEHATTGQVFIRITPAGVAEIPV